MLAGAAAGPDDSYPGASDDELIGVLCAWDRSESHAHARKLAAITELRRRRPVLELPSSGRETEARDEDYLADEIAHALAESRRAADSLAALAEALDGKLPGTRAALLDGVITPVKARIIAAATALLDEDEARAAEEQVLDRAGRITPGSLREAIRRAVMDVAPRKAKDRREAAARDARVEQWAEDSGNAALAGRELPPADGHRGRAADHLVGPPAEEGRDGRRPGPAPRPRLPRPAPRPRLPPRHPRRPARPRPDPGRDRRVRRQREPHHPAQPPRKDWPTGPASCPVSGPSTPGSPATSPWRPPPTRRPPGASPSPTPTARHQPRLRPASTQEPRATTANTGNATAPACHPAGPGPGTAPASPSPPLAATGHPAATAPGSCGSPATART